MHDVHAPSPAGAAPKARPARPSHDSVAFQLWRAYEPLDEVGEDKFRADLRTASHTMAVQGCARHCHRLRLGSLNAVNEAHFREHRISHVVNCLTPDAEVRVDGFPVAYLSLGIEDEDDVVLDFDRVLPFVHDALTSRSDSTVLVHCAMGVSRSASFVCAYLMREHRWSVRDTLRRMRAVRSQVAPNPGFLQQLLDYERKLCIVESADARAAVGGARGSTQCCVM